MHTTIGRTAAALATSSLLAGLIVYSIRRAQGARGVTTAPSMIGNVIPLLPAMDRETADAVRRIRRRLASGH
ncbi:hypothetical protein [Micromonospora sp. RTGN7]|uniref:hypothetical protein n=1 Tax=Micromonospora sp. RTGN7 TaxID=3016526 RepID=UPI0029FF396A|nr:hypothetical protein [Micromonospora sp. RTGN7]